LRSYFFQELLKEKLYSGIKTEIKSSKFLRLKVPYPDLEEQNVIQNLIASVNRHIDNVTVLAKNQNSEIKNLLFSLNKKAESEYDQVPLSEILIMSENFEEVQSNKLYRQFGVKWWGEGVYEREAVMGHQTAYKYFIRLEANDFVFNKIWGRHGAFGIANDKVVGCYGGNEFPTYKYDLKVLTPQWLEFIIKRNSFWEKCAGKSFGTSGKNRIRPEQLLNVTIPLPSKDEQLKLVTVIESVNTILNTRRKKEVELNQLLPSVIDKAFKGEL
jgi:restriction endonuclease S subunit